MHRALAERKIDSADVNGVMVAGQVKKHVDTGLAETLGDLMEIGTEIVQEYDKQAS